MKKDLKSTTNKAEKNTEKSESAMTVLKRITNGRLVNCHGEPIKDKNRYLDW